MRVGRTQEEMRQRHLSEVLRRVHVEGPLTRASLGERLGLNRSTIMSLIADLAGAGLVSEEKPAETGRAGRPSLVVAPEPERIHALAFDVAVDGVTAARVGLGGRILARREAVRPRAVLDLDDVVGVLAEFGRDLVAEAGPDTVCAGVGVSYCGMVRPDGTVRYGPFLGWADQRFGPDLAERLGLGLPVGVGNEAHLGAVAEHVRGAGTGLDDLVYLHGDVGVGGGIIVGGKLLDGAGGYGCEVGHMVVNPFDGRPCLCGSHGCLEAEVGEGALLDYAGRAHDLVGRAGIREVVALAEAGDTRAVEAIDRIGDWLGVGVVNLINLFNPAVVVFGGMLRDLFDGTAPRVRARIEAHVLPVSRERVRLATAALGDDTTLAGAAELAFAALLADPLTILEARRAHAVRPA
ncbi:putative NBD/HSP70 family sugar kinase [Actinocorallia herbida]|uniref:Putative NBD/HSP70 family sugar kinase n=1 Tax=Actinocorallia herbida TaxID=58109 RepID=A0A3N1CYI4_9ACTN|nr:ROK family transcriptional regulator [Actinocorallia herbida]ROO86342.1 putative NBD/HSP70 family sugar kinase [Actinocorallia herbida]